MKNKKITIQCRLCDNLDNYKYLIEIYDCNCNLILKSYTDNYGYFYFNVSSFGIYKIVASNNIVYPKKKCLNYYLNEDCCNNLLIVFSKRHPVAIRLTDENYKNLPITGRMILSKINK